MAKPLAKFTPVMAWQTALQRLYPMILLISIGWLAWLIASSIWLAIAPPTAPSVQPVALTPPQPKNLNTNQFDIFFKPTAQPINQPPPDIKVLGVTVANAESGSYAILNSGGKTSSYNIGSVIGTSQYKLSKVTKDFILVTAPDGTTQKVDFGKKFSLDQSDAIHAKTQNQNLNQGQIPTGQSPQIMQGTANTATPTVIIPNSTVPTTPPNTSTQTALGNAANALQQNPAGYLSSMGVVATGQGYQVTDAMPANIKNRIGLQNGDKVLSVNGQNVGQNPAQDAQVLQQVQQSGQAQIQVQRGEQVITIRQSL